MARENIENLSLGHWVKYFPQPFVDSEDSGIKMGQSQPFSKEPISDVKEIKDNTVGERWGFTPRHFTNTCSDSPEVRALKQKLFNKKGGDVQPPDAASS